MAFTAVAAVIGAGPPSAVARSRAPAAISAPRLPGAYEGAAASNALTPAALDRWWTLFDDPILSGLENEALQNASDAKTTAARILEARATRSADRAKTFPTGI